MGCENGAVNDVAEAVWLRQCDKGVAGSAGWQSQRRFFWRPFFGALQPTTEIP
jgi:hypothetical protein